MRCEDCGAFVGTVAWLPDWRPADRPVNLCPDCAQNVNGACTGLRGWELDDVIADVSLIDTLARNYTSR